MMAFTHAAAGTASALLVAQYLHTGTIQSLLILSGGVAGSYLPDIDHPKSAFDSRVLPLSLPISAIFGHRGITHSLIAVAGMSGLMWWVFQEANWDKGFAVPLVVGVSAGYLSHLFGDWLTNSGVPLLWPSKRRFVSPLKLCTGDFRDYLLAFAIYGWSLIECLRMLKYIFPSQCSRSYSCGLLWPLRWRWDMKGNSQGDCFLKHINCTITSSMLSC